MPNGWAKLKCLDLRLGRQIIEKKILYLWSDYFLITHGHSQEVRQGKTLSQKDCIKGFFLKKWMHQCHFFVFQY